MNEDVAGVVARKLRDPGLTASPLGSDGDAGVTWVLAPGRQ
jgi:hypothetical protein